MAERWYHKVSSRIDPLEMHSPDFITVLKLIWRTSASFFRERPGQILMSAFVVIMLWGQHGKLPLLKLVLSDWTGLGEPHAPNLILPAPPWDQELISFVLGALLLVGIPCLLIKRVYKQPLSDYGLGMPPKQSRRLAVWVFLTLTLLSAPAFYTGAFDCDMRATYPFYQDLDTPLEFVLYQLSYLPFFVAIEFIFRGYLLFGLAGVKDWEVQRTGAGGLPGVFYFHRYAILLQMLSYTAWHLGKPQAELWGTLVWGLASGATALAVRSIWPIVLSHAVLNVFLDAAILYWTPNATCP